MLNLKKTKITLLGSGSWGTAQLTILTQNAEKINWYVRNKSDIDYIYTHAQNPKYLKNVKLNVEKLNISNNINALISEANIVIVAIPSAFCKDVFKEIKCDISKKFIISATKGIVPHDNHTLSELLHEDFGVPFSNICIISGPCHAEEIASQHLSYLTFACKNADNAEQIAKLYAAPFVRSVISTDIYGTEYGAVLKNIYALGAGICVGLGYGDNFLAVFVANAHREMKRFLNESYPYERNTSRSSYLGDLLVTCYSNFSRNRAFGIHIGSGLSVKETQEKMLMIAEGYYAAKGIHEINKQLNISMPIAETIYKILYKNVSVKNAITKLTKELR